VAQLRLGHALGRGGPKWPTPVWPRIGTPPRLGNLAFLTSLTPGPGPARILDHFQSRTRSALVGTVGRRLPRAEPGRLDTRMEWSPSEIGPPGGQLMSCRRTGTRPARTWCGCSRPWCVDSRVAARRRLRLLPGRESTCSPRFRRAPAHRGCAGRLPPGGFYANGEISHRRLYGYRAS